MSKYQEKISDLEIELLKSEQKTDEEVRNVLIQSESQKLISQNH